MFISGDLFDYQLKSKRKYMTYQKKQMIIVYINRSVGKSGHIVSQVAQDLLAFHNNKVDFVMISPRDFKIDLCLELQGLRDYAKLESTKIACNILEVAISVKIKNELLTTDQTTSSITDSSFEMIDGWARAGGGTF
jgi:hypothetical protein